MVDITSVKCTCLRINIMKSAGGFIGQGYVEGGYDYCADSNYTVTCSPRPNTNSISVSVTSKVAFNTTDYTPVDINLFDAWFEFN